MLRTFNEHRIRRTESMDGCWDFVPDCERRDRGRLPGTYTRQVLVPAAWETLPGLERFRGTGWMRRRFVAGGKGPVRLVFGGVLHTATVFIDGRPAGKHYDGFVPWDLVLGGLGPGEHEIVTRRLREVFTKSRARAKSASVSGKGT